MRKTWGKFGVDWHGWVWKFKASGKLDDYVQDSRYKPTFTLAAKGQWVRITITEAKPK